LDFFERYAKMPRKFLLGQNWASQRNSRGWRPLHFVAQAVNRCHLQTAGRGRMRGLALLGGAESLVEALLLHGCDLDAAIPLDSSQAPGFTALHLLAKPYRAWSSDERDDVLDLAAAILRHGGSPDPRVPQTGRTPLGIAAAAGQEALARLLVRFGADPTQPEGDGPSPIEICRRGGQTGVAYKLEELVARRAMSAGSHESGTAPWRKRRARSRSPEQPRRRRRRY
jgi:hypothetical protein